MTLALIYPGLRMGGGSGVAIQPRGNRGTPGNTFTPIYPDTIIRPGDVIFPDGILGGRGSRGTPSTRARGNLTSALPA